MKMNLFSADFVDVLALFLFFLSEISRTQLKTLCH